MRMIVILAAAFITFVATLPVFAKQVLSKTCEAVFARCENLVMSHQRVDKDYTKATVEGLDKCMFEFGACMAHTQGERKAISKYKTTTRSRDPISTPPAGLLETTPGLSPQGPAATGTPSGGGAPGGPRGTTYSR